jgi:hypothetical protein
MPHIVLTDEQARIVREAGDGVEVRDAAGRILAFLQPLDAKDLELITEIQRRGPDPGPRIPSAKVQEHLRKLDEIRQREGLDQEKMLDLLRRMRAAEEV